MDAERAAKAEERKRREAFTPFFTDVDKNPHNLADQMKTADAEYKKYLEDKEREEEARIAAEAAEAARIAEAEAARIAAEEAIIAAKIKAEDEKTKNWWEHRLSGNSSQGGGRRGKKKSKRIIKMKNAKNKSKSKSQSRRQRQKRRRHSRRV